MRIGIDVDDTLLDFVGNYILFHNQMYETKLERADFKTYSFNHAKGGTMEQEVNTLKQFYNTDFFREMLPFPGAVEIIQKLKEENKLFVITSRPLYIRDGTLKQLSEHFSGAFLDVFFSSNYYAQAKNSGKTKAEICKDLEIALLIDDSLEYAKQCAKEKIRVFLFGNNNPWNQNGIVERVKRVKDWKEIGDLLI